MNVFDTNIHREITPLKKTDCFLVFDRRRKAFNYPVHFHPEIELNYIFNADGAKRIVGDHIEQIGQRELILVGPNIYHGWENFKNDPTKEHHEITIQFPNDIFNKELLDRNIMLPVKKMLLNASRGILFSSETTIGVEKKLHSLSKSNGFDSFIKFQSLLYDLAISRDQSFLTNMSFQHNNEFYNSERIEKIYQFLKENYHRKIKVEEVANLVNMSVISLSRLIKQRTGKSFIEFLIEVRLGSATRRLIETNQSISEVCYECGFNNMSNFNRIFKKYQHCTPTEFRTNFIGVKNVY